jgi:hypothetical protein
VPAASRHEHRQTPDGWLEHPVVHSARVGLVSAGLVLAIFAGVLLALAVWLP